MSSTSTKEISKEIYVLRGCQIMFDRNLATHYQVETKKLKQAVRRNIARFPEDYMFEPTAEELKNLRSQFVTSSLDDGFHDFLKPVLKTSNHVSTPSEGARHGGNRYTPFAFTELGVAMLSSVLNNERAIQINMSIMRAFVHSRKRANQIDAEAAVPSKMIENRLVVLEKRFDGIEQKFDQLADLLRGRNQDPNRTTEFERVSTIQNAVAQHWGITVEDLKSSDRSQSFTLPRHIAIYLVRNQLGLSLNKIGRHFGGRDHATILSALRKIEQLAKIGNTIDSITSTIH